MTGEGMSLALLSARPLAEALASGNPRNYIAERCRLGKNAGWLSGWILRASRHESVVERVIGSLAKHPDLFSKLMEIGSGALRPRDLGLADLFRLAL